MSNLVQVDKIVEQARALEMEDLAVANKEALKIRVRNLRGLYSNSPIPDKKELSKVFYEKAIS